MLLNIHIYLYSLILTRFCKFVKVKIHKNKLAILLYCCHLVKYLPLRVRFMPFYRHIYT